MMKHTFVFLLITWFFSMNSAFAQDTADIYVANSQTVQIDLNRLKPVEPLIRSISFLKLDGIDEESIKNQPRIKCDDSLLYVHGKQSPKIYLFNKTGKLIRIINQKGEGPEQYKTITDFFISKNKLFIYDNIQGVLLKYNKKGDYESKLALTTKGYRVVEYNDQYIVYMGNQQDMEYSIWVFDKKGVLVKKYLKDIQAPVTYPVNSILSPMNPTKEGLIITYELDNTLYLYNDNKIRTYAFDFGPYNLSERNNRKVNMENVKYMHWLIASHGQILWMDSFLNWGDLYVVNLIKAQGNERICFTMDSNQVYSFDRSDYPFSIFERDMTVNTEGQFVTWIPSQMTPIIKKLQREGAKMNDHTKKLITLDVNGKTDMVVCFFTMKLPD